MSVAFCSVLSADIVPEPCELQEVASLAAAVSAIQRLGETRAAAPLQGVTIESAEIPEVTSKTEGLWTCISREKDTTSDGYIYLFKLIEACDDITDHLDRYERLKESVRQSAELFPALQKRGFEVLFLDPANEQKFIDGTLRYFMLKRYSDVLPGTVKYQELSKDIMVLDVRPYIREKLAHAETFRTLGFGCECRADGVYLKIPDHKTLKNHWEKLRILKPWLSSLDIGSGDGNIDAKAFLSLHLNHAVVLEEHREFPHDALLHVIPEICKMLDSGTFEYQREKVTYSRMKRDTRAYIKVPYETLMLMREDLYDKKARHYQKKAVCYQIMETLLSAVVDTISSFEGYETVYKTLHTPINEVFLQLLENPRWFAYLCKQFKSEDLILVHEMLEASLDD